MKDINIDASLKVLKKDPKLAVVIKEHGVLEYRPRPEPFQSLVRSVIYQQVSGSAAGAIYNRFVELFPERGFPKPESVARMSEARLRSAGLSTQKTAYIYDVAEHFANGHINRRALNKMTNDEVIRHLTAIKGIGEWTAQMFLIFTLARPDVLPTGDLGVQKGFKNTYNLRNLPDKTKMEKLARPWREHASVASLYLWKAAGTRP